MSTTMRARIHLRVGSQVAVRTWRPALERDQVHLMRVFEEGDRYGGWVMCSEEDWQAHQSTGLLPSRKVVYRLADMLAIDGELLEDGAATLEKLSVPH